MIKMKECGRRFSCFILCGTAGGKGCPDCVGHGAMNSSIVCQIRNLSLEEFWSAGIEKCKLMKLI